MSIVIVYAGRRKNVKTEANTLVQDVITEAATFFNLDPSKCDIRHQRSIISKSQLIRFSNIPNNAQVDLIVDESKSRQSSTAVQLAKLAISIPNGGSITKSFPSTLSLLEVLASLVADGSLNSNALDCCPELIFMRNSYSGERLSSVSLASLGLAGQSGRFLLRLSDVPVPSSPLPADLSPASESASEATAAVADTPRSNTLLATSPTSPTSPSTANMDVCLPISEDSSVNSSRSLSSPPLHVALQQPPAAAHSEDAAQPVATAGRPTRTVAEVIDDLLSSSFDTVSAPAMITIGKYVCNILSNESEPKYRNIGTANSVFQSKVARVQHSAELLLALGFSGSGSASTGLVNLHLSDEALPALREGWPQIAQAYDRLNVPMEDRPRIKAPATPSSVGTTAAAPRPFDVFAPMIYRAAPQPSRPEQSITERKLEGLQKRRRELEGDPAAVSRSTEVIMPSVDGSIASIQSFLNDSNVSPTSSDTVSMATDAVEAAADEEVSLADRKLIAKSIMKSSASSSEDAPLLTESMRALQKAQREKIYSKTLIRIRFPDKVCLQGYFHPRHGLREVYQWVWHSLSASSSAASTTTTGGADDEPWKGTFELFVSPPRRVLPWKPSDTDTLASWQLVPAAVINLTWLDGTSNDSLAEGVVLGSYLSSDLLLLPDGKTATAVEIPTGAQLVPAYPVKAPASASKVSEDEQGPPTKAASRLSDAADGKDGTGAAARAKPKWFKT